MAHMLSGVQAKLIGSFFNAVASPLVEVLKPQSPNPDAKDIERPGMPHRKGFRVQGNMEPKDPRTSTL